MRVSIRRELLSEIRFGAVLDRAVPSKSTRWPVSHRTEWDSSVTGAQSRTRTFPCCISQRCADVGSTSRQSADGDTVYSQAASATSTPQTMCARLVPIRRSRSTPMPASSAAMSCTTTPNRAYARNMGTMVYRSAEGRTKVNVPIVRSGDSEHTSAATATMTRMGTRARDADGSCRSRISHQDTAMSPSATMPAPRLTCCSSSPSRTPASVQKRRTAGPSSGCSTGGTR